MRLEYNLHSVDEFMPSNRRWVIIKCRDGIRTAFYEDGSFWDTAGSKAMGFFDVEGWQYVQ